MMCVRPVKQVDILTSRLHGVDHKLPAVEGQDRQLEQTPVSVETQHDLLNPALKRRSTTGPRTGLHGWTASCWPVPATPSLA